MARTVVSSGTQTATINTEHVLLDDTTHEGKVYDAMIDMANLTTGDVVEIRVYAKLLVGGTLHRVYYARYGESQDDENNFKSPIKYMSRIDRDERMEADAQTDSGHRPRVRLDSLYRLMMPLAQPQPPSLRCAGDRRHLRHGHSQPYRRHYRPH